jgi:hypothetical protein
MNQDDRADLRDLRDNAEHPEDKKLLRKVINHIAALEGKLLAVRVHARAIVNEVSGKGRDQGED